MDSSAELSEEMKRSETSLVAATTTAAYQQLLRRSIRHLYLSSVSVVPGRCYV